jgi:hypothetical protein
MTLRKRIFEIIEQSSDGDKVSLVYDIIMLIAITASIIPLMFVEETLAFRIIEQITVVRTPAGERQL